MAEFKMPQRQTHESTRMLSEFLTLEGHQGINAGIFEFS